jgi:hypothetical protein
MRPASPNSKARPAAPQLGVPATPAPPPAKAVQLTPPPPPPPPPLVEFTPEELAAAHAAELEAEAAAVAHVIEDDDTLNLPAPSPDMLVHRPAPPRPKRELLSRTLGFKQTLIPILLTMGVLMIGIAAWSFALGEESPIAGDRVIHLSLLAIGVVMLGFGVLTMFQVKSQLNSAAEPAVR